MGSSGFRLEKFEDAYKLPKDRSGLPVPEGMNKKRLHFILGNWWLDFPSTGKTMVELWDAFTPRQPAIDGVIAIDLPTIRDLLTVFGAIKVPEVDDPLTAANVVERLSYAVEIEHAPRGDDRKAAVVVSLTLTSLVFGRIGRLSGMRMLIRSLVVGLGTMGVSYLAGVVLLWHR